MNWLLQTTGKINHYNPKIHKGSQPVRVLHHVNLFMFQNIHPQFSRELTEAFTNDGFSKTIDLIYGDVPIQTPYIRKKDKTIVLQETFLSYLWSVIHNIYMIYIHKIDYPRLNKLNGRTIHLTDNEKLDKASELFQYSKSLKNTFYPWDKDYLPNPENYDAENRDDIEQPNIYYTEAIKFILAHEYVHATKHINYDCALSILEMEIEADYYAIELLKKGIHESRHNEFLVQGGIFFGIISLLFLTPNTKFGTHPNTEDRLANALVQLGISPFSEVWDYALIGLKLWDEQFEHNFEWQNEVNSRDEFFNIINQIKNRNK